MNVEEWRDLQLLEAVEKESTVTQRSLSERLGIALGLTNLYVRRLIKKGYLKSVTMPRNRLVYFVTPRGVQRKARLTLGFMKYSLDLYRKARRDLRQALEERLAEQKRVAIFGTGEAAELAFLLLREIGAEPAAVFDGGGGQRFLGFDVRDIKEHREVEYDILIVARLEKVQATIAKLLAAGVPQNKLLLLREESSRRANGRNRT
jgi:DNA-binding MarR family transcriptional regulator